MVLYLEIHLKKYKHKISDRFNVYIDKYKQELEKELNKKVKINLIEVSVPMSPEEWNKYFKARGF